MKQVLRTFNVAMLIAAFMFISCAKVQAPTEPETPDTPTEDPVVQDALVKFYANSEMTKTVVGDDMKTVMWKAGDGISVMLGEDNLLYTATNDGTSTEFATETVGVMSNAEAIWAVYPYSESHVLADNKIQVRLAYEHNVVAEGFAESANLTVAYTEDIKEQTELSFKNVCSYLKVKLDASQMVQKITLSSDSEVPLAGLVTVGIDKNGLPEILSVDEPVTSVTLVSETALNGTYLIPVLPGEAAVWTLAFVKTDGTESTVAMGQSAAPFVRNTPLYYDFTSGAINWKVAPSEVVTDKVFWSDAHISWNHSGKVDAYKVYADGNLVATVDNGVHAAHITGLANGTTYNVKVCAVYGAEEKESETVQITTGAITQLTKNVSPTSVAVAIENRAGALSGNYKPCLYVQLFESEDASAAPKYEMFVRDNEVQSEGHPFYKSLVAGSGTTYPPFNLAFGGLSAGTDYWFRVKSVASVTYASYRVDANIGKTYTQESQNGDSEYSQLVRLTTSANHVAEENEVFYEGFDDFSFGPDFVNCAVGLMPAFKTEAKSTTIPSAKINKNIWSSWATNGKPWCFHGLRLGFSNTHIAALGFVNQQKGDTDITFEESSAAAVKYWVTESKSSTTLKAPKVIAGARIGSFQVAGTTGFETLVGSTEFVTLDSYTGQGCFVLGNYYSASESVNTAAKPAGFFGQVAGSLSTSSARTCVVTFKALAIQGTSGKITAVHLDRNSNHRNASTDLWETVAEIPIADSNGSTVASSQWSGTSETHRWYEYSFEVNLKSGDLIGLTTNGKSTICLDEVKVVIK